jgi:RNA polymerase sigma factor (sigma-70 family)
MAELSDGDRGKSEPEIDPGGRSWEVLLPSTFRPPPRVPDPVKLDLAVLTAERPTDPAQRPRSRVEGWFLSHSRELGHFLRRYISTPHEIDDCLQETFLRVWRQEQQGTLKEEARGYLFATALNIARDRHRRNQVRCAGAHDCLSDEMVDEAGQNAEAATHWRQGLRQLELALAGLRQSTRTVFLLHHVECLTYPEIARRQGITTRTVEREMARALSHCALRLQPFLEGSP